MKRMKYGLIVLIMIGFLTGCTLFGNEQTNTNDVNEDIYNIYLLSVSAEATTLTYEEWLASVQGPSGSDGREVVLRLQDAYIQWQYTGDTEWENLLDLQTLTGDSGVDGTDGREITLQVADGFIQWQYVGSDTWTDLLDLSSIQGMDGLSTYELYLQYYPEYTKSEEEWLDDLINNRLVSLSSYTVSFDSDGGTPIGSQTVNFGYKAVWPQTPIKEGFNFSYWGYFENHTWENQWSFAGFSVTEDITLKAIYTVMETTVMFTVDVPFTQTYTYGEYVELPTPEREGYLFDGWYYDGELVQSGYWTISRPYVVLEPRWNVDNSNVVVLDQLPDEEITITFWHIYGQSKAALLDEMIYEFELLYPNITIISESKGSYTDLLSSTKRAIGTGVPPNIVTGYSDHFAEYIDLSGLIPLDNFVNSEIWGVDLDDFIASYVAESSQFEGGMYGFPFSKSTEIMYYNKDKFAAAGLDLSMYEVTYDEDGIHAPEEIITWEVLTVLREVMVGTGENQCDFLTSFDSSSSLFINSSFQWNAPYTNQAGDILFDNDRTRDMLTYLNNMFDYNVLALPIEWGLSYGSEHFLQGDLCMTVGSTAGMKYNIPLYYLDPEDQFDVGILPVPQFGQEEMTNSAIQQGPDIAILGGSTSAEQLASWIFIKYLTNTENTARWAVNTGYLPVRYSGYEHEIYQSILNESEPDLHYESLVARTGYYQTQYYHFPASFAGVGIVSSSMVRDSIDDLMEMLYVESISIDDLIAQIKSDLIW